MQLSWESPTNWVTSLTLISEWVAHIAHSHLLKQNTSECVSILRSDNNRLLFCCVCRKQWLKLQQERGSEVWRQRQWNWDQEPPSSKRALCGSPKWAKRTQLSQPPQCQLPLDSIRRWPRLRSTWPATPAPTYVYSCTWRPTRQRARLCAPWAHCLAPVPALSGGQRRRVLCWCDVTKVVGR